MQGTWYIEQVEKLIQSPLSASLQHVSLRKTQLPRREAHRESPQGLPHRLRALQDTPLANNPPGPRTTGSRANRMSRRLPATVVLLLYLSLISLSPHPVFSRLAEPTATSLLPALATLRHPPHTRTHTLQHNHTPRTASRDTIRRPHTPPHFTTYTHTAESGR